MSTDTLKDFLSDQSGVSAEVFKLTLAIIIGAVVFGIIIGFMTTMRPVAESTINKTGTVILNVSESAGSFIENWSK